MKTGQAMGDRMKVRQMVQARPVHLALLLIAFSLGPFTFILATAEPDPLLCGTLIQTGCETWTATHDGNEDHFPIIVASPDGERAFIASIQQYPRMVAIQAYSTETGKILWNTTYSEHNIPAARMLAVSPDGSRLHIVGTGFVGPFARTAEMFFLTYDALDGTLLWFAHQDLNSEGKAVLPSPDGSRVYVVGSLRNNYATLAYDAQTGEQLWASYYDAQGGFNEGWRGWSYDVAYDLAISPDGSSLYVTGHSASHDGPLEYATVKYDTQTGAQGWDRRHQGTALTGEPVASEAYRVVVSPDGQRVYVFGTDGVKAYDAQTGADLWTTHTDTALCRPYWPMLMLGECVLEASPEGDRLFVYSHNDLAAYDANTGETLWHMPTRVGDELYGVGRGMVMSLDGTRLYTTAPGGKDREATDSVSSISLKYETTAIDASNGWLRWRVVFGTGDEGVHGITISPDGSRIFVTGTTHPSNRPPDILTVAYDTNLGLENAPMTSL